MGWTPHPAMTGTYDQSNYRQRQTKGDTLLPGGGKISISPGGCQSAVGREVTRWPRRRRPPRRQRRRPRKRSKSIVYEFLPDLRGPSGPRFFFHRKTPDALPRRADLDATISKLI